VINRPIGPFDSAAIINVCSREMLDVLLDAGADINARSRWWAGGFGLLDSASPELAAYAIERGAVVDVHAAARLGLIARLRELITQDPPGHGWRAGQRLRVSPRRAPVISPRIEASSDGVFAIATTVHAFPAPLRQRPPQWQPETNPKVPP